MDVDVDVGDNDTLIIRKSTKTEERVRARARERQRCQLWSLMSVSMSMSHDPAMIIRKSVIPKWGRKGSETERRRDVMSKEVGQHLFPKPEQQKQREKENIRKLTL